MRCRRQDVLLSSEPKDFKKTGFETEQTRQWKTTTGKDELKQKTAFRIASQGPKGKLCSLSFAWADLKK
jgi:hypothetical protein